MDEDETEKNALIPINKIPPIEKTTSGSGQGKDNKSEKEEVKEPQSDKDKNNCTVQTKVFKNTSCNNNKL